MARRMLVVTTVAADDRQLRERLRDVIEPDAEVRVVAPAARIGKLDWLTNAEDDARAQAEHAADTTASALSDSAAVTIDRTSHDTEPAQDIEDALRNFEADEIVLVTSPDGASTWLEDDAVRAALDSSGLPVRRVEVPAAT